MRLRTEPVPAPRGVGTRCRDGPARRWTVLAATVSLAATVTLPVAPRPRYAAARPASAGDARVPASMAAVPAPDPAADPRALRIVVDADGPVAVTGTELASAGWDLATIDPSRLSLQVGGLRQGFEIVGLSDGRLDEADAVVFPARAITGIYTRENVYWLTSDGGGPAMGRRLAAPRPGVAPAALHRTRVHVEQDTQYYASMRAAEGDDRWLWGDALAGGEVREVVVTTTHRVADATPARLRVRLHGYGSDDRVTPDHHVRVAIGGMVVAEARFDGIGTHVLETEVPARALADGRSLVAITSVGDTGSQVDLVVLNWIELEYWADFSATGDRLAFEAPADGPIRFEASGFTGPDLRVLDVTDPTAPVLLDGVEARVDPAGSFTAAFTGDAGAGARYVVFTLRSASPPARVERNEPSHWRDPDEGADYVAIVHRDLAAALDPLVERRQAQGHRVAVVDIQDVYDEESHGVFDPRAIRSFLRHAYEHWPPPRPAYVLLVGESSLDYRRAYRRGPPNLVPSIQVDVSQPGELGAVTSDAWFASVEGPEDDAVTEMAIGRFSASTAAEVATIVSKTLAYEAAGPGAPWRGGAVLVADDGGGGTFEEFSEELAAFVSDGSRVRRFYAETWPRTSDLLGEIALAVEVGTGTVNFVGHGHVDLWSPWPGGGHIFDGAAIGRLRNGPRLPILTSATCMNGWIDHPIYPVSMAERWLTHPGGGGVAAWAPSGYTVLSGQRAMFHAFYRGVYGDERVALGDLARRAAAEALSRDPRVADVVRMFVLLGDPALPVGGDRGPAAPTVEPPATPSAVPSPPDDARQAWLPLAYSGASASHCAGRQQESCPAEAADAGMEEIRWQAARSTR